jgi:hypothetical protein
VTSIIFPRSWRANALSETVKVSDAEERTPTASLCFRDPGEALTKINAELRENRVPRIDGTRLNVLLQSFEKKTAASKSKDIAPTLADSLRNAANAAKTLDAWALDRINLDEAHKSQLLASIPSSRHLFGSGNAAERRRLAAETSGSSRTTRKYSTAFHHQNPIALGPLEPRCWGSKRRFRRASKCTKSRLQGYLGAGLKGCRAFKRHARPSGYGEPAQAERIDSYLNRRSAILGNFFPSVP